MADYGLMEYQREEGRIILTTPRFDYDSFPELGDKLVKTLSASVVEKQWDADIHSWLIDFEGCQLFLKSEHYSESVWLEVLNKDENREELDYLAGLFETGFDAI
ncbi:conserved hypothetical protein [Vibrio nigripulchritudo MADA3029]|uniref:DUF3630 family protein n=1 Tax=Vibrio TaxID=662 RepID=UPI0003B1ABCC|nr:MULTISPECIES: DUF3630 family protein [Vibrio]UAB70416.1 DUF3630 family protein [Vibrio sp. SCSIO 43132]CCN49982.1 conserved hypothetical protein [Vibrio nigripulchritudo MADA3020]CCN53170.1 conserved hypothetical protein [Vibrio nigripulchritudo MADA3021]CCN58540.1 conserved hypothetical protein [Vibrio nigripulchritudo MADA3029]CCN69020.1 conserved hypothetical protein [Vibrio nigripulchritudo SFn118]